MTMIVAKPRIRLNQKKFHIRLKITDQSNADIIVRHKPISKLFYFIFKMNTFLFSFLCTNGLLLHMYLPGIFLHVGMLQLGL
ncbi:hypothetical protein AQUCO_01700632v1 [Aquilegia coerulea]|uniref:Uncharacterized protein n=1 Tax=Aquilegia coerulea TaxID=218851 RepID=A0A2G5DP52_AQUCA|nr:hypothetical protein AQUCO_01700632v1 [Aquilegia coerulea]